MVASRPRLAPTGGGPAGPAVVAQRLCDLLLSFPSAASGGVQWHTLARKYEEWHAARLDLAGLGYSSPLAAATALLWDVFRLVDAEDTDNPVVAVEDHVVLTPRPGSLGSWPSLYQTFCQMVLNHGVPDRQTDGGEVGRGLLLSKLKPLLQIHWHTNFEESSAGYLSDEGTWVRLKKMKHLVQAVLRWRDQRVAWRAAAGLRPTEVDEAISPRLDLVPSKKYNDLVLRCLNKTADASRAQAFEVPESTSEPAEQLEQELALLRAENARLRSRNELLEQRSDPWATEAEQGGARPCRNKIPPELQAQREVWDDPYDNPYEPPPELGWPHHSAGSHAVPSVHAALFGRAGCSSSSAGGGCGGGPFMAPFLGSPAGGSTAVPSDLSGPGTPLSVMSFTLASNIDAQSAWVDSGAATPSLVCVTPGGVHSTPGGVASSSCTGSAGLQGHTAHPVSVHPQPLPFVPMWWSENWSDNGICGLLPSSWQLIGDRGVIPNGIVQQARAMFEPAPQQHLAKHEL